MSREKVKLPKEVAAAIEYLRSGESNRSNYVIMRQISGSMFTDKLLPAKEWAFQDGGGTSDLLMEALVNGYVVEATPEDKLRTYYEGNKLKQDLLYGSRNRGRVEGILYTLNTLGITIEGVND